MSTFIARISGASPRVRAKCVGGYYLLTILAGAFILFFHGRQAFAADVAVAIFYLLITAIFYAAEQGWK